MRRTWCIHGRNDDIPQDRAQNGMAGIEGYTGAPEVPRDCHTSRYRFVAVMSCADVTVADDTCALEGFSPGVGMFNAGEIYDAQAMVHHYFSGSWKHNQ